MITDQEIADLLEDETKEIAGDIHWAPYIGRAPAQIFSVQVHSVVGWPLRVHGSWNEATKRLTYAVIHAEAGRIIGLDLGDKLIHHGPNCPRTRSAKSRCDCPRDAHMHRWTEQFGGVDLRSVKRHGGLGRSGRCLAAVLRGDQPRASGYPARAGEETAVVTATDLQTLIGDAVRGELHEMFEFFPAAEGAVGVNAVLTYPDREEVQVWVLERDGEYLVTDHGEACGWLFRQGYAAELTAQQQSLVESVRRQLWLESDNGPLVARCPTLDAVPYAILRVALAAVRVADISYTCAHQ